MLNIIRYLYYIINSIKIVNNKLNKCKEKSYYNRYYINTNDSYYLF